MSTDVPLKVKSIAAKVFASLGMKRVFTKLLVMMGTMHQLVNLLRIVRMYSLHGRCLYHTWGKLRIFGIELLAVQNEVQIFKLTHD